MAGRNGYDRLPPLHESQDIVDITEEAFNSKWTLQQPDALAPPPRYSSADLRDAMDHESLRSFDSRASSASTGTSIEKIKSGWNRIRRKPIPGYLKGSIRRHPAANIQPTRIGRGVWKDQLLVDRSLRSMAVLTALFAIGMIIVIAMHMEPFRSRANKYTSSVGGEPMKCSTVTHTNTALLLLINVGATMVLGMSNTYQQLVTSLKIGDIKYMLQKFGDSRVGTNSPFSINHKQEGKRVSWAIWVFLVCTSMPIHFLANSLIGPSYIVEPPVDVQFNASSWDDMYNSDWNTGEDYLYSSGSFLCWSAFRTGTPHYPRASHILVQDDVTMATYNTKYSKMIINYSTDNCTGLERSATDIPKLEAAFRIDDYGYGAYIDGECEMGQNVFCSLYGAQPAQCRLNVRMNAAFVLASCLIAKAVYMIAVNLLARGRLKRHVLTFGDVIVASASDPELRVQGECLVNAGDSYRRKTSHTCHKRCTNKVESKNGDELGHCQSCSKWNTVHMLTGESQPSIATKIKKSLISNLANTALTQMCLLMFCSFVMLGASIFVASWAGMQYFSEKKDCQDPESASFYNYCNMTNGNHFDAVSGGFGGFNQSRIAAELPPNKLANEMASFCISNGAQFIYSLLYLMLIYNMTLVSQEHDWGKFEKHRKRPRCTIVRGDSFSQDYLLQLPKKILFPIMAYSVLTHWMLGEALQTQEAVWIESTPDHYIEHSRYLITYAAYPLWIATLLVMLMTGVCWWAYTYKRDGFIPQMFGSIRTLCASTTQLDDFPSIGIQWGDLGMGKEYRHAGLSAEDVMMMQPYELYTGMEATVEESQQSKDWEESQQSKDWEESQQSNDWEKSQRSDDWKGSQRNIGDENKPLLRKPNASAG